MHYTTTIFPNQVLKAVRPLLVLVSVFPQFFLAFVGCNLSKFTLSSAGHFKISLHIAVGNKLENSMNQRGKKVNSRTRICNGRPAPPDRAAASRFGAMRTIDYTDKISIQ
jgi:hypothetical protein